MTLSTNLTRRGAVYYARAAVPADLQARLGRVERWESLRTKEPADAKRKVRAVLDRWDREDTALRQHTTLSDAELQNAIWRRYIELITADERFRLEQPTNEDLDAIWRELDRQFGDDNVRGFRIFESIRDRFDAEQTARVARHAAMRVDAGRGETKLVAETAQAELKRQMLPTTKGTADYRKLAQGLQRAELEALQRASERDGGDYAGEPRDPLVRAPTAGQQAAPGESLLELFEAYATDNPKGITRDTINQSRMAVKLFAETIPPRFPVARLDKKAVRIWKQLLDAYPVKAAESTGFRGMTMPEIVKANEKIGKPAISIRTINRYLSSLGAFCDWLITNDYLDTNPVDGLQRRIDKTKRKTLTFTVDEQKTLFSSPLFTGCQSDQKMHLPGKLLIRDHRYWLPLLMLFTGARARRAGAAPNRRRSRAAWRLDHPRDGRG